MTDQNQQQKKSDSPGKVSLAEMVAQDQPQALLSSPDTWVWIKVFVLGALFVAMHFWQIRYMVGRWQHDPNWSHGFIIPLFSLYLLFSRRNELFTVKTNINLWGLAIMILGIVLQIFAYYPGKNYWSCHLMMIPILIGLVLYLGGAKMLRVTWLPIVFLVFAMPVSELIYGRIAFPLQNLAAKFSALLLQIFGIDITVSASHLTVTSNSGQVYPLTVAEACSGVRSLMAFVALAVAMAYLEAKPVWQRAIIVASAVPIAILCNVIRVAFTSMMYVIDEPEFGRDFMHEFMGLVMLIPAFIMLWLLGWLLQSIFVEADDDEDADGDQSQAQEVTA